MSFSINTNILAMNALNNLNSVTGNLSNSMNRLSTGLRINNAADDPAGLIISQEMTAQVGGMGQAIQNSQEAINFVKTADGGLSQMNTLLNSAYSLAVGASNSATLSTNQLQADQQQLSSIASSITQIAQNTTYGGKHLLDGTAGVQSSITDGTDIASLNIGGTFKGVSQSQNATISISNYSAGSQGSILSTAYSLSTDLVTAGSFTLNGVTFTETSTSTVGDMINQINQYTSQTGVVASLDGGVKLSTVAYGSHATIDVVDATGTLLGAAQTQSAQGTDATASMSIGTLTGVLFTGGLNGNGGLTLQDADGNTFTVSTGGNTSLTTADTVIGQSIVGSAQFQTGAEAGQRTSLSLGNFAASQLGVGAVTGLNLSNLDLTTSSGAADAMKVIQKAINDISSARGGLGNFQTNVLQTNVNSLTTAQQNLSASLSTIQDTNIAQEMTNFTKLQILEQSGMSILGQANQLPQQILSLIKNG
ncbi:MAG TPA: flagellin [Fimbriimonas sp.]|nr:flagellin [Fimbriimonas sp.]